MDYNRREMEINQLPYYESELGDIFSPFPTFERSYTIPLCNCQFPLTFGNVGYHRTKQEDDICIHCEHYVFYGSERDITDVSEVKPWGYQDDVIEAVKTAYMASGNASAVAREFGVSKYTIYNWKKLFNWETKKSSNIINITEIPKKRVIKTYNSKVIRQAEKMYEKGEPMRNIAKKLGVVRRTLNSWQVKYKWERK